MLRRAETKPAGGRLLLIHDVSRSGRLDPRRKIFYEEHLRMHGVHVMYVTENFRHDGSMEDGLIQYIAHYRAKDYKERLSKDTFRGMTGIAELGLFCGGRPPYGLARMLLDRSGKDVRILQFGERKSEKSEHVTLRLNPDTEIVETARWIFVSFDRGMHIISIVNSLNARKIPSPKGGIWTKRTIREILANPVYMGTHLWGRRKYTREEGKALVTFIEESKRKRRDNVYPAIIDKALFERVQDRLKLLKQRRNNTKHHCRTLSNYPLTGGTCTHCGKRFGGQVHQRRKKDKVFKTVYYECMGSINGGIAACPNLIIPKEWLQNEVADAIRRLLPRYESRLLGIVNDIATGESDKLHDVKGLGKRANEIDQNINRLLLAIERGLDSEVGVGRVNELRNEKTALQNEIRRIQELPAQDVARNLAQIREHIDNFDSVLAAGTPEERRAIFWSFVDHWTGNPNTREVEVVFKSDTDLANDSLYWTTASLPYSNVGAETVTDQAPATISQWSVPDTWVTDYTEDIGNTFDPKGFAIGSKRIPSRSK
jgi:hypothetical protein